MNYIYDILLNYSSHFYDIFEWNKEDDIIHIRKIPVFKISTKSLHDFIYNKVKIDDKFLSKIYQKTELFTKNKVNRINNTFLASDEKEVVAFKCNHNGYITEYSKLLIEEEIEVLEYCENMPQTTIDYESIGRRKIELFKTRNELIIKDYIISEIQKIINNNDKYKLQYLYLDCFQKTKDTNEIIQTIYKDLEEKWEDVYYKIYSFLKMTANRR